jgi:hypothetical protein
MEGQIKKEDIRRVNAQVSLTWIRRVDEWRRRQQDIPNISESIRRLVEIGLDQCEKKKRA